MHYRISALMIVQLYHSSYPFPAVLQTFLQSNNPNISDNTKIFVIDKSFIYQPHFWEDILTQIIVFPVENLFPWFWNLYGGKHLYCILTRNDHEFCQYTVGDHSSKLITMCTSDSFPKLYIRFEKCESYFDYNVHTFNELLARQFLKEECMAVNDRSCLR